MIKQNPIEFFDRIKIHKSNAKQIALYTSILELKPEVERELFEKTIPLLKEMTEVRDLPIIFYDFLRIVYKDKPEWAETIKAVTKNFDEIQKK